MSQVDGLHDLLHVFSSHEVLDWDFEFLDHLKYSLKGQMLLLLLHGIKSP